MKPAFKRPSLREWAKTVLNLRLKDSNSQRARLSHLAALVSIALCLVVGLGLAKAYYLSANRAAGIVFLAAFTIYILERITSLLWEWPLNHQAIKKSTLVRHPLLLWLVTFLMLGVSNLEPAPLYLIYDQDLAFIFKAMVMFGVIFNSFPFWLTTCFLVSIFRGAKTIKSGEIKTGENWAIFRSIGQNIQGEVRDWKNIWKGRKGQSYPRIPQGPNGAGEGPKKTTKGLTT